LVNLARTWKASLKTATTPEETTTKGRNPVQDKGKRKIAENQEGKKRCKMKVDPILEKEALVVEAKRE